MKKQKIRVGFYNPPTTLIETNNLYDFNPGVGGTEYLTAVLIKLLKDDNLFDVSLFFKPQTLTDSLANFDKNGGGIFILIIRHPTNVRSSNFPNTKIITWAHCEYDHKTVKSIESMSPYLNVFLSEGARNHYCYSPIIRNSSIIGNFTQTHLANNANIIYPNVCYIGALFAYKHCETLMRAWPKVIKKIPEARLTIIGSDKLYNGNDSSGEYQKELLYPLLKNNCQESVDFKGLLNGKEIFSFLQNISIGVVNPIGSTETFCTSAIEFGAFGIPTIGGKYGGLRTTIPKKCGFLVTNHRQLAKKIIFLLNHLDVAKQFGANYKKYVHSAYSFSDFCKNWKQIIKQVNDGKSFCYKLNLVEKMKIRFSVFFEMTRLQIHRVNNLFYKKKCKIFFNKRL